MTSLGWSIKTKIQSQQSEYFKIGLDKLTKKWMKARFITKGFHVRLADMRIDSPTGQQTRIVILRYLQFPVWNKRLTQWVFHLHSTK